MGCSFGPWSYSMAQDYPSHQAIPSENSEIPEKRLMIPGVLPLALVSDKE